MAQTDTVVLVMTDVAGSTRLWHDAPEAMDAAMRRHHEIVHGAVATHGGWRPVDQGEGDAVFAAFSSPTAALAAAVQMQRTLGVEQWPDEAPLSVRVGVHAGEVVNRDGNLFGDTVNRCARIRGLGSGGQTLMSSAVYELVRDRLPVDVTARDLGEHRMKDLVRAERIWQLDIAGLAGDFPPLASLDRASHNLPVQPSSFVGREQQVAEVVDLVRTRRLVTVLGFGGMGKTRLALQVGAELADGSGDGVWFVDLSNVTDPARVPAEVAAALGVHESGSGPGPAVLEHLAGRRLLLILDNVEQVLDCAEFVAQLLATAPGVKVLATSREPLHLQGEAEYALPPMPTPPTSSDIDAEMLSSYDAVRLFVDRAVAVRRDFAVTNANAPAVAAICAHLDGHPLAIELAAARVRMLPPDALLARLDSALSVLTGGGRDRPLRHQTLRATIAWSYDALTEAERLLLDRLSAFPGSLTLDAAEAVCAAPLGDEEPVEVFDAMTALVDKNLVRALEPLGDDPDPRFDLLASIRDFAVERLTASGHVLALGQRHAAYYSTLGAAPPDWTLDEEARARNEIQRDFHNLGAALGHLQTHGTPEQLVAFSWLYYFDLGTLGRLEELLRGVGVVLERHPQPHPVRVILQLRRAWVYHVLVQPDLRRREVLLALEEAHRIGTPDVLAYAAVSAMLCAVSPAEFDVYAGMAEAALATPGGSWLPARKESAAMFAAYLGLAARWHDPDRAIAALRATPTYDQAPVELIYMMARQAQLLCDRGDSAGARALLTERLAAHDFDPSDEHYRLGAVLTLARADLLDGDLAAAGRTFREVRDDAMRIRQLRLAGEAVIGLAECAEASGCFEEALAALRDGLRVLPAGTDPLRVAALGWREARCLRELGDPAAGPTLDAAWAALDGQEFLALPDVLGALVERAAQSTDPAEVVRLLDEVAAKRGNFVLPFGAGRELERLRHSFA